MQCEACGIFAGQRHLTKQLITYKGYELCPDCSKDWESACERMGKDVSFEQFKKGLPWVVLRDSDLRMLREYAERLKRALHKTSP